MNQNESQPLCITIMAAGEGKRMNSNIPKVLHPFKGIPMLVRIVRECIDLKPSKIIIITGKYHDLIKETVFKYIREHHSFENKIQEVFDNLFFIKQEEPKGTGHAIHCTLDSISTSENVLILNGDMPLVSGKLLQKFVDEKPLQNARLMVADLECPFGYGRILTDSNKSMIGIREEKDCSTEEKLIQLVNVGMYYVKGEILKKYIPLIKDDNVQKEFYLTDLVKVFLEDDKDSYHKFEYYCIEEEMKYQIYGVNTQQELRNLENKY